LPVNQRYQRKSGSPLADSQQQAQAWFPPVFPNSTAKPDEAFVSAISKCARAGTQAMERFSLRPKAIHHEKILRANRFQQMAISIFVAGIDSRAEDNL